MENLIQWEWINGRFLVEIHSQWEKLSMVDIQCVCVCFVNENGSMVDSFNLWFFYEMVHSMGDLNGNGLGWYAVDDEWMVNGWWMVCYDMDIGYLRR